uniref:Protein SEY1 (EC) n=1 Tax=Ganoderma boninense TaxID=34458 RepID=A0A5K1JUW5_9APHY|nr:Protein SEY1 (EC [Ganoderma boninense]
MSGHTEEHNAGVNKVLSGETTEYIVTHPGRSQYSREGGVDEIHKIPIFRKCLKIVTSDYGQAGLQYFEKLIGRIAGYTKSYSASSCVIITRPPEIVACFCLADAPGELFVIFDSHPRPGKHPNGAAFIFKNSARSTAEYLTDLLRYDERLLSDSTIQWQAQLLAHCSGDIFIARRHGFTSSQWAELALDASLELLRLQSHVRSLENDNENLSSDKQRLRVEVEDLEDQLLELDDEFEQLKARYEQLSKSYQHNTSSPSSSTARRLVPRSPLGTPSATIGTSARNTPSSRHPAAQDKQKHQSDLGTESTAALAIEMQLAFDEENRRLERERKHLKDIQPEFFDCNICFERHQDDFLARVVPCGHSYCRPCLRAYAVSKIMDHRFPIICPSCVADRDRPEHGELDDFAIQQLGLDEKQYQIFNEMQMDRFSTIIHCRKYVPPS